MVAGALVVFLALATAASAQAPTYRSTPLSVTNGAVTLAGTLTMPEGQGPFPAVVFVTGSGAQNRDEDIFGFKVFGVLADHLTRQGIAVFRYDDRGVGESTGRVAASTTADFGDDALAGVARLAAMHEIDPKRVGILGHSEGATAAAIAAAKSPTVAFIVLLAGPSLPGDVVTRRQATDAARVMGADDAAVAAIEQAHRAATEAVRSGAPIEALTKTVKDLIAAQLAGLPAAQRAMVGDAAAYIEKAHRQAVAQLSSASMRFLMTFDPAEALRKVTVPVYAAFGSLDTQVLPSLNETPLKEALARNAQVTVKVYPEANHLFQRAKTGLVTEYASLERAFVPAMPDDVAAWIRAIRR